MPVLPRLMPRALAAVLRVLLVTTAAADLPVDVVAAVAVVAAPDVVDVL